MTTARELEAIFDAQAKRDRIQGSDHPAFGEGPAFWGYIRLDTETGMRGFSAKPSEQEARDLAASHPGYVTGLNPNQYPSIGVARIEFVTYVPPLDAHSAPLPNPFTKLLQSQAVRPISADLLPGLHELEKLFDATGSNGAQQTR
ncbi:hypothetical protein E3T61_03180 [Cryobacterium lactosi]|uniref:Uncharacterized protein n=1 Tax=Cryobacterium lactosi TaxID=1259202 RepID=A0A4R9C0N1_9MICO|nr:hypothetical protein [Cryobacterium lactosi]TFD94015.1 hypothetical protein E3T61_03180 [Cryobacterium lactosi]